MTGLLVSVRSAAEAEAALRGGASLLDVKEPANGPLGRAPDAAVAAVVTAAAGRRPVSAALGELRDLSDDASSLPAGLAFVKAGLAGLAAGGWPARLGRFADVLAARCPRCEPVFVAYADHGRAGAPCPAAVCAAACARGHGVLLVDTWGKDGTTLLHWLPRPELEALVGRCRVAGVRVALAGALGAEEIRSLAPLRPDWFAVRGAACGGRDRAAAVEEGRVRRLAELLRAATGGS
jgi:uncharacterized protein (UPF0264 family)